MILSTKLRAVVSLVFLTLSSCSVMQVNSTSYISTSEYYKTKIEEFSVYIAPKVNADQNLSRAVQKRLRKQIIDIRNAVPSNRYDFLSSVPIWVELEAKEDGFIEYHLSRTWLSENGYNPEKAKSLEISNLRNFLDWSTDDFQKSILLHELSHAFFHSLRKEQKALVKENYKITLASGLYRNVTRKLKEEREDAYALEDYWEYFAELSESFFGENEYFPFNNKQFKEYDPKGYALIKAIWYDE